MDKPAPSQLTRRSGSLSRRSLMKTAAAFGAIGGAGSLFSHIAYAEEKQMLLATTKVEDLDRFLKVFSTTSLAKRKHHGSKGATVFRDPNETDRVWVVFDWDENGWQN